MISSVGDTITSYTMRKKRVAWETKQKRNFKGNFGHRKLNDAVTHLLMVASVFIPQFQGDIFQLLG
jgi:hypothetical protein